MMLQGTHYGIESMRIGIKAIIERTVSVNKSIMVFGVSDWHCSGVNPR